MAKLSMQIRMTANGLVSRRQVSGVFSFFVFDYTAYQ